MEAFFMYLTPATARAWAKNYEEQATKATNVNKQQAECCQRQGVRVGKVKV